MMCQNCNLLCAKYGKHRNGLQRFRCQTCSRTFTQKHNRPLGKMRLSYDHALSCLKLLIEGVSIRSTERITGVGKRTILSLLLLTGRRCEQIMDKRISQIKVKEVQADEIWGFVGCKQKTKNRLGKGDDMGDAWCFVAIERYYRLILAWHLGQRTVEDTETFIEKLNHATAGEFQLTTDGFEGYPEAVSLSLGVRVSFAQLIKTYRAAHPQQSPEGERRYSPSHVLEIKKVARIGQPDPDQICTSHVERQNLTIRMMMRRMTRLTNAFSKKRENLRAAFALHFAYYNFCRIHRSIRCTPAMEAGVTKRVWELKDLMKGGVE
jgi:transposase-like protein/IS1 family transposase